MNLRTLFSILAVFACSSLYALDTNSEAPDFTLTSVDGKTVNLSDYKGKTVVLEWYNMGCPFVVKHYKNGDMQALQSDAIGKGVVWLTINSTNPNHKDFRPTDKAAAEVKEHKIASTAMLVDSDGKVGKLYGAKTTPHMFVIDPSGKVVYQGAIDDASSVSANPKESKNYVRAALDEVLAGKPVTTSQTKQYGCGVKYGK
jgi:peroxiredoxin